LAFAAVDDDEVGPGFFEALGVVFDEAFETAGEDFFEHGVVVALFGLFNVEKPVGAFVETITCHGDHGTDLVGAADVAVVVNFDAFGGFGQIEDVLDVVHHFFVTEVLSGFLDERFFGIFDDGVDEAFFIAFFGVGDGEIKGFL